MSFVFSSLLSPPVAEVEGECDSISSLCTQITSAFSGPPEDPFSSAPMPKPVSSPQSPVAPGNGSKTSSDVTSRSNYIYTVKQVVDGFCVLDILIL